MASVRDIFFSLLTSGKYTELRDEKEMDAMLRLIVLNITYTFASFLILGMGVSDMGMGLVNQGLVQIIIGFMIFTNLFLLRTELPFLVGGIIVISIFAVFCGISVFTKDEMDGFASLWIYSFPLMSIFTLGLRAGLVPSLLLLAASAVGTFVPGLSKFPYTLPEAFMICGVYSFVLILTVIYEYVRSLKDRWLTRQDSYMNMVFQTSPDIMLLIDKDRNMVYCADVFLKKTHIKDFSEIRLQNYRDVFARITDNTVLEDILAAFKQAVTEKTSVVFNRALDIGNEGILRYYEIRFTPMYDAGVFQGAFILFHDMTEIMDTKERAEQASRAKTNFLANMSHEIRTPMNAIIGMTAIARNTNEVERKDYCLEKIDGASVHLLRIINDILDMSKIEADKLELSPVEFDFAEMIRQTVAVFEFPLAEKKQSLSTDMDPAIPRRLVADEQRLSQIISNLLSNAIKFTPENGRIGISAKKLEEADGRCTLELAVSDTGIGISPEQQGKLFQSFVQVDNTISRKFGGMGLGLAISRKIVGMMGGSISIESREGTGSVFSFTVKVDIAAASGETPVSAKAEETGSDDFSGRHILLAEDVEINREIVISILAPLGLSIAEAENGQEALDKYTRDPAGFDLIFMDIHMPGMDGYETTRKIREFETRRSTDVEPIPIIAMTANVFEEDVKRCLAEGMNGHVGKPLDFEEVIKVLRKYLAK